MQTTETTAHDGDSRNATQAECLDHLCRLENRLTQLQKLGDTGPSQEKLDVAKIMLVDVTDFAEARLTAETFESFAPAIHAVYKRTKSLEDMIRDDAWGGVKRLLGRGDSNLSFEITSEFEGLRKDYSLLFVQFFVKCINQFDATTEDKKSFLEGVDIFVTDFARAW